MMSLPGQVVTLPRLLSDVDQADASRPLEIEVPPSEHAPKNSEIQQVLRPAHHGRARVEQANRRRERQDGCDGGSAAALQAPDPEQRRCHRRPRVPSGEEGVGFSLAYHLGGDGDARVWTGSKRRGRLLVHPDRTARIAQREVRRTVRIYLRLDERAVSHEKDLVLRQPLCSGDCSGDDLTRRPVPAECVYRDPHPGPEGSGSYSVTSTATAVPPLYKPQ